MNYSDSTDTFNATVFMMRETNFSHTPPQSLQRAKKGKKETLTHNLSRPGQVGPLVAFFQIITS